MSQGTYNSAPPPASSGGGGSKVMMIVLIVVLVLGLVCAGACGACYWGLMTAGKALGGAVFATMAIPAIEANEEVTAELGENLMPENASMEQQGNNMVVTFDVKGSMATGKARAEFAGADPNNPGGQAKASSISVTLPSGKTVNVSPTLPPPTVEFGEPVTPDMPDDSDSGFDPVPGDSNEE